MRKIIFVSIVAASLLASPTFAQDRARRDQASETSSNEERATGATTSRSTLPPPARRTAAKNAAATPAPGAATPAPERRGFFSRLFGRRSRPEATPTPAPKTKVTVPPPASRKSRRPASETSPDDSDNARSEKSRAKSSPHADDSSDASAGEKPSATAEKKQADETKQSTGETSRKKSSKEVRGKNATPPPELATPEAQEKWKYDEARKRALEDPDVQALKQKADAATDPDEGRRALRAYNKALFDKMRSLEPSVKDRINAIEAGVMKRLGE
jgi:hypothetical protein